MKLFSYESAKKNEKSFLSMTSLSVKEFDKLAITFDECWNEYTKENEKDIKKGGRPSILATAVDRLFFILFYLKTYPLQEVLAFCFEMSQAEANELIYKLSLVLKMALQKEGFVPPRTSDEMVANLENEAPQNYVIDGTERPINRPVNDNAQRTFYSGKKKRHTVKNNIIVGEDDNQIKGLSATHEGKKHDKKICDEEQITLPAESHCYQDTGFQGLEMENVNTHQPKKKPRNGELTPEEKKENRLISSLRIVVEHVISGVKRCRIVKDVFRNLTDGYDDRVMELACALHNFRTAQRRQAY